MRVGPQAVGPLFVIGGGLHDVSVHGEAGVVEVLLVDVKVPRHGAACEHVLANTGRPGKRGGALAEPQVLLGKVGEFVLKRSIVGHAADFLHGPVEHHAGWRVGLVLVSPSLLKLGHTKRVAEGGMEVILNQMAFRLDVLKGVLDVHAVVAPSGSVDLGDGFEVAEIGRFDRRCVGRCPLATKQHTVVDFVGWKGSSRTHGSEKKRKRKAQGEGRTHATGSGQWDMNPTSFGSLVSGFFIGVAVAFNGFVHLVGEEFGSFGEISVFVACTHLFEAALDAGTRALHGFGHGAEVAVLEAQLAQEVVHDAACDHRNGDVGRWRIHAGLTQV